MNIMQELVRNVLDNKFEDFDPETVDYAKNRITDTIGALIGGASASGCSMILDLVREWGGKEESTILVHGDKVPVANAALVMGIMARSNDFEPGGGPEIDGKRYPGHFSATAVPTAFAVAEQKGVGGKELITALILGDDLASRIGVAGAGPWWDIGWDPSGICNRFGATAIAGKLRKLSESQMLNAFGIVLNQLAGTMQAVFDGTHCFKLHQGLAAWNGIFSVELASRGFTGPKDPLLSRFGYFNQYCREVEPEIMTRQLGKKFYSDDEFKLYPCCRGNHASIECALKIVSENDIVPEDIAEVILDIAPAWNDSFLVQPFKIGDVPQVNAILNLHYNVANALLRKSVTLEHYTDEFIRDPRVVDLAGKVKINATVPGKTMSSRVRVKMKHGGELFAFTEVPRGNLEQSPLTRDEIKGKFRASVAFSRVISQENAEKALNMLDRLEELKNVEDLVKTLTSRSLSE